MSKKQIITGNITPPNKDLETLKKHFPNCFDKSGNLDFEKLKKQLSATEINFSKESYGMDWLGKSYARLLATDETTTLLKEDETFNQKEENKNSENLLIKGDNLEVLKHLSNAYYEKIKMIYIDPPYNTGSDGFVYADDRKFTKDELQELAGISEERAKRILDFTQSNSNSHSAWLTFMYPRLYIAKQLLKEDGVIFISIDDNEVAQLRLLMDEVFGEENTEIAIWKKVEPDSGKLKLTYRMRREHEYVLVAYKNKGNVFFKKYLSKREYKNKYTNPDNDPRGEYKQGIISDTEEKSNPNSENFYSIKTPSGRIVTRKFRVGKEEFEKLNKDNRIYYGKNGDSIPSIKIFINEMGETTPTTILENLGTAKTAGNEIESFFGNRIFNNPKPTKLVKRFFKIATTKNDLILDFFAGSGTTADAVMQLNAEDGGNRKFILAQLPEKIDPKKNKVAYNFVKNELKVAEPTIFEITKERLIRAAKKIKEKTIKSKISEKQKEIKELESQLDIDGKDEKIKQLKVEIKALENQDLGFKIFETMPIWEDYNFEADELDAQQMLLFDESKLTKEDVKALLITWKTYDGVSLTQSLQEIDLGETQINNSPLTINNYKAHYSNGKLYLMNKGFKTKNLKTLLEKIDSDTNFNPTTIIAFGYHFESKNLREISENIKSYANKKSIDIDFITRY